MEEIKLLSSNLVETLICVSKQLIEDIRLQDMRELLRLGYLKINFGAGWDLTEKGNQYLLLIRS